MFKESLPIAYDAPADLKKWPSLNSERRTDRSPYLVYSGTLADCIRELLAKPIRQISLYDIVTEPQPIFDDLPVLSPAAKAFVKPTKPPVVTAVAPKQPIGPSGAKSGIIFVGGKPVGANDGALNTQPIPPGHPVPVDPTHRN